MSASDIILIITAIGSLITLIGNTIITVRNGRKVDLVEKTVNSAATAREAKIDSLLAIIAEMTQNKVDKEKIAERLAEANRPT